MQNNTPQKVHHDRNVCRILQFEYKLKRFLYDFVIPFANASGIFFVFYNILAGAKNNHKLSNVLTNHQKQSNAFRGVFIVCTFAQNRTKK